MQKDNNSSILNRQLVDKTNKLKPGDKVAILSPSSAAPEVWPGVYALGIKNLEHDFKLQPVEYPTTKKQASFKEKMSDLEAAFADPHIKAVISTIGGDCEIEYIKNLKPDIFIKNPKPFFGFSDNTHLLNFLWLNGISGYYGGSIFTQYATKNIDDFTKSYLNISLFESGVFELKQSSVYIDKSIDWNSEESFAGQTSLAGTEGWVWDGDASVEGTTWGGCLESIDDLLRQNAKMPSLDEFSEIVLITETSEEIPSPSYCYRVFRALGERGILSKVRAVLCGRPQAWFFDKQLEPLEQAEYRAKQREAILKAVRKYNKTCPVVQNMDFGHTNPQIPLPYGRKITINSKDKKIFAEF